MGYVDFALICIAVGLAFMFLAWVADRRMDAPVNQTPRPDRHLPADEYRLLGDDWRDNVRPFFTESFIRNTRRRLAVFSVTGADPERTGSAPVGRPDPVTRTGSESSYASTEQ
jgi:hypothetical protein